MNIKLSRKVYQKKQEKIRVEKQKKKIFFLGGKIVDLYIWFRLIWVGSRHEIVRMRSLLQNRLCSYRLDFHFLSTFSTTTSTSPPPLLFHRASPRNVKTHRKNIYSKKNYVTILNTVPKKVIVYFPVRFFFPVRSVYVVQNKNGTFKQKYKMIVKVIAWDIKRKVFLFLLLLFIRFP